MKNYRAELHVHTVLSPCADVEMIPPLIVQEALDRGIQLIAITDHNATANIAAVQRAAAGTGLIVLPGMEIQTEEEVHSLCLFDDLQQALDLQRWVNTCLPNLKNNPDFFGEQFIVDETGDFLGREDRLLLVSAGISLKEAWKKVTDLGGLFIPAHVNRQAFGLLSHLGFVPTDFSLEILEISRQVSYTNVYEKYPQLFGYPLIQSGDVHYLDDFLGANEFLISEPTIAEIRQAVLQLNSRNHNIRMVDPLY